MNGFGVLRPGPQSLLQDHGRAAWQHLGVSPCGPADMQAAAWANYLLGNRWGTPLLEVALGGLSLACRLDTWVAVTGAQVAVRLDGQPRPNWSRFAVQAGQQLQLGPARTGQRAYLAVAGGFSAQARLGSVAVQQREGAGGLHGDGRALQAGDLLICRPAQLPRPASVPARLVPDYAQVPVLRVIVGGEGGSLPGRAGLDYLAQDWRVSPQSDRMGVRLYSGGAVAPRLPLRREWSRGVCSGEIQLPPDGQPIILLADRQSMGGYPALGWVHPLDLGLLAQCAPRQQVRFRAASLSEVQAELAAFYGFFRR